MSDAEGGAHILVVEDQEDSRVALEMFLEMQGYRVTSVESAELALRAVEAEPPDFVITDFSLPEKTGVWLLEQLIAQGTLPKSGALIVTGHPSVKGPTGVTVMQKPVDLDKLVDMVNAKLSSLTQERKRARPEPASADAAEKLDLVLYVSESSLASHRAQRNLARLLKAYPREDYRLEVLDVTEAYEQAAHDRVDFTPALIKRSPGPRAWLLGDFADPRALHDLFAEHGLEPKHG